MSLSDNERRRRLKKMLEQIAPAKSIERLEEELQSATGGYGSEELGVATRRGDDEDKFASESLQVMRQNGIESIDDEQRESLEAIIHRRYRPALYIENNSYKKGPAPWNTLLEGEARTTIERSIPSVGRIDLPRHPSLPYGGTGFVVGDGLIMTNRHVADYFARGIGTNIDFKAGQSAEIDFKQEQGSTETLILTIDELVMIHPYWDMALLSVTGLTGKQTPLALSVVDPRELTSNDNEAYVVTIGYPAEDRRNDYRDQARIFERFDVKRLQPGVLRERREYPSYGKEVNAVTHDCSTLGGNSGSSLIDIDSGHVVGLHFAGEYMDANFAVPTFELARDNRVVDAGVNFVGKPPASDFYPPIWRLADSTVEPPTPIQDDDVGSRPQPNDRLSGESRKVGLSVGSSGLEFTVPIHFSLRLGSPIVATSQVASAPTASDKRATIEGRFGRQDLPDLSTAVFDRAPLVSHSFSWKAALSTALASDVVYQEAFPVETRLKQDWGFDECEFIDNRTTQCFVASTSEVVLVCFRGTQELNDWLTNLELTTEDIEPFGAVHSGFHRGFTDVRSELEGAIGDQADRPLVVTGHSLGGALATIAAAYMVERYSLTTVYTFGQPAVGKRSFPGFMRDSLRGKFFRFVNDDDIVTRIPPFFRHVGRLYHFNASGDLKANTESVAVEELRMLNVREFRQLQADSAAEAEMGSTEGIFPSVSDHSMSEYIAKIVQFTNG